VEAIAEPDEILTELRRSCPVSTLRPGVHFLVRYEDVSAVLRDHESFSAARPSTLEGVRDEGELTLQEMDGPRHDDMRRIVLTAIPRDLIARVEPYLASVCRELVDKLACGGRAELVSELIEPAAKAVVAELLGVPEAERERVYRWAADIKAHDASSPPARGGRTPPAPASKKDFDRWIREEARRRLESSRPPDDVFTRLLNAKNARGEPLSETEFATQIRFLSRAGIGSIVRLTGNLLYELIRVPERYRRVRADRGLLPVAIDESLRHDPPGDFVGRTCLRETMVAGTRIRPGEQVILSITSAHRDESQFPNGENFDLDRGRIPDHLAFGRGRHRCPGAAFARMVTSHVVSALMDQVAEIRLAPGFRYEAVSFSARGPRRLDVEVAPQVLQATGALVAGARLQHTIREP
jgi:cytochrome P450